MTTTEDFTTWTDDELANARPANLHPADARALLDEIARRRATGSQIEEFTLPASWASYLINGDASGMEDEEQDQCDAWLARKFPNGVGAITCDDEPEFRHRNDSGNGLAGDCLVFSFITV